MNNETPSLADRISDILDDYPEHNTVAEHAEVLRLIMDAIHDVY